mmetsp:Transcript_37704/g.75470  ORF Transcript_37704/g.75470 Transcript_37704/m.75470 type:complete len:140 (-) Transcript_37704:323-742(-)
MTHALAFTADTCAICRNKLYEPSIEAQASEQAVAPAFHTATAPRIVSRWRPLRAVGPSYPVPCTPRPSFPDSRPRSQLDGADPGLQDDAGYSIAWGCCGHVFHLDCISRWLKTRSVCPLCNREWEFAKIEKIATYGSLD